MYYKKPRPEADGVRPYKTLTTTAFDNFYSFVFIITGIVSFNLFLKVTASAAVPS